MGALYWIRPPTSLKKYRVPSKMYERDFKKLSNELSTKEGFGNSLILFSITLMLIAGVYWANSTEIDNVTRGDGKIVSALQNQLVQAAEAGVILEKNVSENDIVRSGQTLFVIDPIDAQTEMNRINQKLSVLKIKERRLQAEISGTPFDVEPSLTLDVEQFYSNEFALYQTRQQEINSEITILQQQKQIVETEVRASSQDLSSTQTLLDLIEKEIALIEPLVREKIAPETRLLALQREQEGMKNSISQTLTQLDADKIRLSEIDKRIETRLKSFRREAMETLSQTIAEKQELEELIPSIEDRLTRSYITAPVDGIINRLNVRTKGAYVAPGDIIVEIVPINEGLKLEARILPKDISNIKVNDNAKIRLSAYDSAKYGSILGYVTAISPDAIIPADGNGTPYFLVDIVWEKTLVLDDGREVQLFPGMTATIDVISGKKSILEYFWRPIAKIQELALRD